LNVDNGIDVHSIDVPYLLFQPLVENAIKHGIATLQNEGTLTINMKKNNNDFEVVIIDNGKGFDQSMLSEGHGLKLTKERIALMNQVKNGTSIGMEIKCETNTGTTITLNFKNYLQL
jgi:LytS/YehU family sensor histidine kinase